MARARTIKPGFFANDQLAEFHPLVRLLFAGLWCLADKEGRLLDRPKKIKAEVMAYDKIDVEAGLVQLTKAGFIVRYEADGLQCIQVLNWLKHQHPHPREDPSLLPPMPVMHQASMLDASLEHGENSVPQAGLRSGLTPEKAGARSGLGPEKVGTGRVRARLSSSGTSSSSSSSSSLSESDARAPAEADEEFKTELEDEFWEALGTREAVRTRIAAALSHTARLKYDDQRAYLRWWLQGDVERAQQSRANGHGPPVRRNGVSQLERDELKAVGELV